MRKMYDFCDVMLLPYFDPNNASDSRQDVKLNVDLNMPWSNHNLKNIFPIMSSNMDTTGSLAMAKQLMSHECLGSIHKHHKYEEICELYRDDYMFGAHLPKYETFYSLGANEEDFLKLEKLEKKLSDVPNYFNNRPRSFCLDVANGYSKIFLYYIKKLRDLFEYDAIIMAGNVVTPEMTEKVLDAGADIVKVGLGNGSVCLTRIKTGVGSPQLSALLECSEAARQYKSPNGNNGLICSDGGCQVPADIVKAFVAGADIVMLGGMLAGTKECDGDWIYNQRSWSQWVKKIPPPKKYLKFHGMASKEAQEKWNKGLKNYRASEGKEVLLPYKGPVANVIDDIKGSVRSACTYLSVKNTSELNQRKNQFILCNRQSNEVFSKNS